MMRFIIILLISMLIIFLVSCVGNYYNKNLTNFQQESQGLYTSIGDIELRTVTLSSIGGISNFHVEFPSFHDFVDEHIVNINRLIYDMIVTNGNVNGFPYELFSFRDTWIDTDIKYDITFLSDELISIHFFGSHSGGGVGTRGFTDIQKALTIDLRNGEVLSLGDFFSFDEMSYMLNNIFLEGYWTEFQEQLKSQFFELLEDGSLLSDTRYFYIKEGAVGLIGWDFTMRDRFVFEIETIIADLNYMNP